MKGKVLKTAPLSPRLKEPTILTGLNIAAEAAAAAPPAPREKTEDLGGKASCPRKVMRERAKPRSAGRER